MANKKILSGKEARLGLKEGIDKCADVVKVSLGGYGRNVAIFNGYNTDIINDGVTIAKEVNVKDEILQAGIQLAKQCAEQTNRNAGDGTTTTLVLLQSILNEIIQPIQTENPRDVRDRLMAEAKDVLAKLDIKEIETREDMFNLATTSCLDTNIANMIADIYEELGREARITVEEKPNDILEKEIVKGIQFESVKAELLKKEGREVFENCHVLVLDNALDADKIQEKIDQIKDTQRQLCIIANGFDRSVLISFEKTPNFRFIPVEYKQLRTIRDLADYVGNEPVDKIILDDRSCTIIGGKGDVEAKIEALKAKKEETNSEFEKDEFDERIAGLQGGIAIIKIGKSTDVERIEYVLKIEDAINAVKGALEEGYCKGGGQAIVEASYDSSEQMRTICNSPYKQIMANAGSEIVIPGTVIDSAKTIKESLMNALSTATSVLTVEAALIEEKDEQY